MCPLVSYPVQMIGAGWTGLDQARAGWVQLGLGDQKAEWCLSCGHRAPQTHRHKENSCQFQVLEEYQVIRSKLGKEGGSTIVWRMEAPATHSQKRLLNIKKKQKRTLEINDGTK